MTKAGRIVLEQKRCSSTWWLQLRKEAKAAVLLWDANTRHWYSILKKWCQERQKYLLSLLQPSSTNMTVELLWDLTVVWAQLACGLQVGKLCKMPGWGGNPTYPWCCQGIIAQGTTLRNRLLEFDDDSKPGKNVANKSRSRICKDWGLGWSQNQK